MTTMNLSQSLLPLRNSSFTSVRSIGSAARAKLKLLPWIHSHFQHGPPRIRDRPNALERQIPHPQLPHLPNDRAPPMKRHAAIPIAAGKRGTPSKNAWHSEEGIKENMPRGGEAPGTYTSHLTSAAGLIISLLHLTLPTRSPPLCPNQRCTTPWTNLTHRHEPAFPLTLPPPMTKSPSIR